MHYSAQNQHLQQMISGGSNVWGHVEEVGLRKRGSGSGSGGDGGGATGYWMGGQACT